MLAQSLALKTSGEDVREVAVPRRARDARPSEGGAAVQAAEDQRVCADLEQYTTDSRCPAWRRGG